MKFDPSEVLQTTQETAGHSPLRPRPAYIKAAFALWPILCLILASCGGSHSMLVTPPTPDFSLTSTPATVTLVPGGASQQISVNAVAANGFEQTVTVAVSGLPSGVTANPATLTLTPGTAKTITLTASSAAAPGSASIVLTGTSGALTHSATVAATISSTASTPDFSLSVSPTSIALIVGGAGTQVKVLATAVNSFTGSVSVAISGLPTGVTASPATLTLTPGTAQNVTLTAAANAALGGKNITFTGTSGTLSHTAALTATLFTATPPPDFSLTVAPASLTLTAGATGTQVKVLATPINSFTGTVSVAIGGLPAGVTASPATLTLTPGTLQNVTLTAASAAATGSKAITFTGTSGALSHAASVALTVSAAPPPPDFSLSVTPTSLALTAGATGAQLRVLATGLNSFTGTVSVAIGGLPAGVTASPATLTLTPGTAQNVTLTAASTASAGSRAISLTGTSGTLTHAANVALTVSAAPPPADFSLSVAPTSLSLVAGATGSQIRVLATALNSFTGTVSVAIGGLPTGVTASPATLTLTPGTAQNVTLTAASAAAAGSKTLTFTATSGALTHSANVGLTVTAAPPPADFSLSVTPTSLSLVAGATGSAIQVSAAAVNSFTGSVSVAIGGLPTGVTASPATLTLTPGASQNVTLTAASTAAIGSKTLTLTGTSGTLTHTANLALTVSAAPDFSLSVVPTSLSLVAGATGSQIRVLASAVNSFTGSVSVAIGGLPTGVTASPATLTLTPGASQNVTLTASSTAAIGSKTIAFTGTSGSLTHAANVALTVSAAPPPPDFSLSLAPTSLTLTAGATGSVVQVSATAQNSFTGAVAVAISGLPTGVTASPATLTLTPGVSQNVTLTAASTAATGSKAITFTGTSGALTHAANVAVTVAAAPPPPDFSLSVTPTSLSLIAGTTGSSVQVSATALNSFTGSVSVAIGGLPTGVTASPATLTLTPGAAQNVTLTASSAAAIGSKTLTITGTSGSLNHSADLALTVAAAPDFSLSVTPTSLSLIAGTTGTSVQVSATALNAFTGSVSVAIGGLPTGVTASPATLTLTPGAAQNVTLTASSAAAIGSKTLTITGTSGSLNHAADIALTVAAAPDFLLSVTPASLSLIAGATGTSVQVSATALNSFTGNVSVAIGGLPTGVTASPASLTLTPGTAQNVTLTASSAATIGSKTLTLTGTSGTLSHAADLALTVAAAPDFLLSVTPTSLSLVAGTTGTSVQVSASALNSFTGSVAVAISGLPTGVTASPATLTLTPGAAQNVTLTASSAATIGSKTLTLTGTSGTLSHAADLALTVSAAPDFSLSVTPTSLSLIAGATGSSVQVSATALNSFTGSVSVAIGGLPTGVTANPATLTLTPGAAQNVTLTASSAATIGSKTLTLTGTSGTLSHTANLALTVATAPDFSLSVTPTSLSLVAGATGSSVQVSATALNAFTGSVSVAITGLPTGVTASPATLTLTPGAAQNVTLTASSAATTGSKTLTLTGTSGALTHAATLALTVAAAPPAADFSFTVAPASLSLTAGATGSSIQVSASALNSFTGNISVAIGGLPTGVTASPASLTLTPGAAQNVTLTAASTAAVNSNTITFTATSGTLNHTANLALTVTAAPPTSFVAIAKDTSVAGVSMANTATYVSSISATTTTAVPVGDYVVCTTEAGDSAPAISFTDNVNGIYPVLGYAVTGGGGYHEYLMVYGVQNTSAVALTITQKFNISVNATGSACDFYKNVNGANPVDPSLAFAYLDQSTQITSLNIGASFAPSGDNEMAFCPMSTGVPNATVTAGPGLTLGTIRTDNAVYPEYQVQTAAAAVNCPFTLKSPDSYSIGLLFLMPSAYTTGVLPFQGTIVAFSGLTNGAAPTAELLAGGVSGGVGGYFGPELDWYAGSTWNVSDSHSTITGTTSGPTSLLNQTLFLPAYYIGNYNGNSPLNLLDTVSSSVGDFVQMNLNSTLTQMSWGEYIQWDNSNSEPAGHAYDVDMVAGKTSDFVRLQLVTTGSGMQMNLNSAGETTSTAFTGSANTAYWVAGEYNEAGTNSLWVYSGCPSACTLVGHTTTPDGRSDPITKFLWGLNDTVNPVTGSHIWFRNTKICWPSTHPNACMP